MSSLRKESEHGLSPGVAWLDRFRDRANTCTRPPANTEAPHPWPLSRRGASTSSLAGTGDVCAATYDYEVSPQVLVAPDVLRAWTEECDPQSCDGLPTEGSVLRLFSSNDYIGLSCHPLVCRAAADAVLRHGMGTIYPGSFAIFLAPTC